MNLGGIGDLGRLRFTAIRKGESDAKTTVIHVFNIKTEKQLHHVTMAMEFVALKALSQHTMNQLTSTFQNIIIRLQLKRMGQSMKHGLRSIILPTILKKVANTLRFLTHGATKHNHVSRTARSVE